MHECVGEQFTGEQLGPVDEVGHPVRGERGAQRRACHADGARVARHANAVLEGCGVHDYLPTVVRVPTPVALPRPGRGALPIERAPHCVIDE